MKKQFRILVASFVAITSLMGFAAAPLVAAAPGSETCTWTGGGSDDNWSTVGNWSGCSSAAPVSGDSLAFPGAAFSGDTTMNNDISSLALADISMTGVIPDLSIDGNAFTLNGNFTNDGTTGYLIVGTDIALGANSTFKNVGMYNDTTVNIGAFTLTMTSGSFLAGLGGSGDVVLTDSNAYTESSNNFTGTITVKSESLLSLNLPDGNYGTAKYVVEDGGRLGVDSTSASVTLPNDVTLAGSNAVRVCLANSVTMACGSSADSTITFTGVVTLTANANVAGSSYTNGPVPDHKTTFVIAGAFVANGFTLSAVPGSNTVVQIGAAATTSAKAPSTGLDVIAASPVQTLAITALLGSGIYFLSRRVLAKSAVRR